MQRSRVLYKTFSKYAKWKSTLSLLYSLSVLLISCYLIPFLVSILVFYFTVNKNALTSLRFFNKNNQKRFVSNFYLKLYLNLIIAFKNIQIVLRNIGGIVKANLMTCIEFSKSCMWTRWVKTNKYYSRCQHTPRHCFFFWYLSKLTELCVTRFDGLTSILVTFHAILNFRFWFEFQIKTCYRTLLIKG